MDGWTEIIYSRRRMFAQAATTLGASLVLHGSHLEFFFFTAMLSPGVVWELV